MFQVTSDDAPVVEDDVVVDGGEAEALQGGVLEEVGIGDDGPVDGVALQQAVELGTVAVEEEAEDLDLARAAVLLAVDDAERVLAVVVP